MLKTLAVCLTFTLCIYTTEKEVIEKQAKEVLNNALNHAGFAISGFKATHSDAIGAGLCAGHGIMNEDKAYNEFKQAQELFEQSREYEHNYNK